MMIIYLGAGLQKSEDMSSPVRIPPSIEDIFYKKNFIADLASVSHDQDFELNLFFSSWKVHQYLEKFSEHQFLISGENFLSPRQARPPS